MKTIVSNTSPIRYLTSIGEAELFPQLFGKILIPKRVYQELTHKNTPHIVRQLLTSLPVWVEVCEVKISKDNSSLVHLDAGEIEAIFLAEQKSADLLLMDEKKVEIFITRARCAWNEGRSRQYRRNHQIVNLN